MDVVRIGVIGLGTIGQTHVDALRQLSAQIFGADPSAEARERVAAFAQRCFADYEEMFASADLDGVVIATPPRTHRAIALQALSAGLGVLCEKPLAVTLEDCQAIASAARSAEPHFQVGFCHRFQPQVRALARLVSSNELGEIILINVSFVHGLAQLGREWITDRASAGGGVLFDSGSHAIDLFRHLAGDVDEVHGLAVARPGRVEDSAVVCLRSGDTVGTLTLSWKAPPWQGLVEVIGSRGRARVDYDGSRVSLRLRYGEEPWRVVRTPNTSRFVGQMWQFLDCVRGQAMPRQVAAAEDGLEATRIVLQVYADGGRPKLLD